jgi:transposase
MEKFEIRAVIKYLFLKGLTDITDIKKELDSSPSNTTVKRWVSEFKMGRKSINDEPRSGRPIEVTTAEKAKTVASASKVMATVFWDARGIIFIDYLQKGKTITGVYYANLLEKLNEEIKRKRPHLAKKKSAVPSRQCTSTHVTYCDVQNSPIKV